LGYQAGSICRSRQALRGGPPDDLAKRGRPWDKRQTRRSRRGGRKKRLPSGGAPSPVAKKRGLESKGLRAAWKGTGRKGGEFNAHPRRKNEGGVERRKSTLSDNLEKKTAERKKISSTITRGRLYYAEEEDLGVGRSDKNLRADLRINIRTSNGDLLQPAQRKRKPARKNSSASRPKENRSW